MTEINCKIFRQYDFYRIYFFSNVYISVNTIIEYCYLLFRLKNRPSIKYVRNCGDEGGHPKSVEVCAGGRGVEKLVIRYVRTKWMAPNKFCGIFFCALVRPSTLEHHRQQEKCRCFLPS